MEIQPPTPTPTPNIKIPLKDLLSYRELIVGGGVLIYILFFFIGKLSIDKSKKYLSDNFLSFLRNYFAIVPQYLTKQYLHRYGSYFTGRSGYQGGVISIIFPSQCDPIGKTISILKNSFPTLTIEFILTPPKPISGFLKISNSKPNNFEELKLKQFNLPDKLSCFTDIGEYRSEFLEIVSEFIEKNPKTIESIEFSDINTYETREESKYVARFEFSLRYGMEGFINEQLVNFIMNLTDKFVTLKLSKDIIEKNISIRNKIINEEKKKNNEEKKIEKKLTPEEQEKLDKKLEKREAKKFNPRIKYGK